MSFKRQPLLKREVEEQLKHEMLKFWRDHWKAKDIAEHLSFGIPHTTYEQLKPWHVYTYRSKFLKDELAKEAKDQDPSIIAGYKRHRKPAFKKKELGMRASRYKHRPKELGVMQPEDFIQTLNEKIPLVHADKRDRCIRSYLIVSFYTPLRKSEIFERTIDDIEITETKITFKLLRKKKGHEEDDEEEPISIQRSWKLVDEVVDWLEGEEWKEPIPNPKNRDKVVFNLRPWNFGKDTALNYVKKVFPNHFPHFLGTVGFLTKSTTSPKQLCERFKPKQGLQFQRLNTT
jgi:integrase